MSGQDVPSSRRRRLPTRTALHVEEVIPGPTPGSTQAPDSTPDEEEPTETFLLVHGYGCTSYMWRHWVPELTRRGRVLLVDMKGFGRAPKPDDDRYAPIDLATAVVDLIREHDLRRLTLFGQSLGGGVALATTILLAEASEGDRVERMVLLSPTAYPQRLPPFVWFAHRPGLSSFLLRLLRPERIVRWSMRSVVYDPSTVTEDQVRAYAELWSTPEGRRAALTVARQLVPTDFDRWSSRYPELGLPALILWGDHDPVVPLSTGRKLARAMPRAELVVLHRCGHMTAEERPEASWVVVERFLEAHPVG